MIDHKLVQAEALRLATAVHRELESDLTRQIDVYAAITKLGIALAFKPLVNLSGAFLPADHNTGGVPAILINARHPRSRQRFSAAHELGHYIRDGVPVEDMDTDFLPRAAAATSEREYAAESFASWFLMPRALVDTALGRLGRARHLTPEQIYRLSLECGTSYSATAYHLHAIGRLTWDELRSVTAVVPKWIKQQLAVHGPSDSWGDVWRIERTRLPKLLTPRLGDEIVIELEEIPSTGYFWQLLKQPHGLQMVESSFELPVSANGSDDDEAFGAVGTRLLTLRVVEPGIESIELVKKHPWEETGETVDRFSLEFSVEGRQEGYATVGRTVGG